MRILTHQSVNKMGYETHRHGCRWNIQQNHNEEDTACARSGEVEDPQSVNSFFSRVEQNQIQNQAQHVRSRFYDNCVSV